MSSYNYKYKALGTIMNTITYSMLRRSLASVLDQVNDDHAPVMITRQNGKPVVLMSLEYFYAYEEAAYLMASSANAERLRQAKAQYEADQAKAQGLTQA